MIYDFSKLLNDKKILLHDFLDTYTSCIYTEKNEENKKNDFFYYTKLFDIISREFSLKELGEMFEELAKYKISLDIPYVIISNEIYGLKHTIISNIISNNTHKEIVSLLKIFKEMNNIVANVYLEIYIEKLISSNNVRQSSLSDLVEKHLISHYEDHLIWLTDLAKHIRNKDKLKFPQLDETKCAFGGWLYSDAKNNIHNNSKYKTIENTHKRLHLFANKIYNIIDIGEYHILITYLEKCELISLSIGTELALLDQISMNKEITKDSLTSALNRHALKDIFENQYELSLATNNPFILAMCDLDYFKKVNDTYGHVAGDHMLKLFVRSVQKNIRNSDVIIRYGGEEFIIILPSINKNKGLEVLEKVRDFFSKAILKFDGKEIQSTVSIGMMEIKPEHLYKHSFLDEHIKTVDQRLYRAKDEGRNRVVFY